MYKLLSNYAAYNNEWWLNTEPLPIFDFHRYLPATQKGKHVSSHMDSKLWCRFFFILLTNPLVPLFNTQVRSYIDVNTMSLCSGLYNPHGKTLTTRALLWLFRGLTVLTCAVVYIVYHIVFYWRIGSVQFRTSSTVWFCGVLFWIFSCSYILYIMWLLIRLPDNWGAYAMLQKSWNMSQHIHDTDYISRTSIRQLKIHKFRRQFMANIDNENETIWMVMPELDSTPSITNAAWFWCKYWQQGF